MSASGARPDKSHYIIRGGIEGRERLRILSRVMQASTLDVFERAGARPGLACLEVACGGGDVAFDLARIVAPGGSVIATDIDETKLELARLEAAAQGLTNLEFRLADIMKDDFPPQFDLVHARFLLTHLSNPGHALQTMRRALRHGGVMVVEDIDFQGYFCHPDCPALWRYVELYTQAVRRRGGDANIGQRLPALLLEAGFETVQMSVVQPAALAGETKLLTPITMENIADAVLEEQLASREEIDRLVDELYEYARSSGTIGCIPRVVQAWGLSEVAGNKTQRDPSI